MSHCKRQRFRGCLAWNESAARSDTRFDPFRFSSRIDGQRLKNRSLSSLTVSSQAPKPHFLLLLFSPFHYRFLFFWTKAFCFETEELCRNLLRLSVPIFSLANDAEKLCLCGQGPFAYCCVLGACPVRWRCMPLSCRLACAHFGELSCAGLYCNVLSATTVTCRACVCAVQKGAWVTSTQVCVVRACLGPSTLKHELVGVETCGAGKDGILLEHWLKQEAINLFKGLGCPHRLQGNLSSTEIVNLLKWGRRHQDHTLLVLVDLEL